METQVQLKLNQNNFGEEALSQIDLGLLANPQGMYLATLNTLKNGSALVQVAGLNRLLTAQSTIPLGTADLGCRVVLSFTQGPFSVPLILGRICNLGSLEPDSEKASEELVFEAQNEIVLKCGKASIRLTRDGKVVIRGTQILSRSSGANKIKGASVHIN